MKGVIEFALDHRINTHEQLQSLHFWTIHCRIEHFRHHAVRQGEPNLRRERRRRAKSILRRGGPLRHYGLANDHNNETNPCHPRHLWLKILYAHASKETVCNPSTHPKNGRFEKLIATKTSSPGARRTNVTTRASSEFLTHSRLPLRSATLPLLSAIICL